MKRRHNIKEIKQRYFKMQKNYELNKEKISKNRKSKNDSLSIENKKIKQKKWRKWQSNLHNEQKNKMRNASKERYHRLINLLASLQSNV